MNSDSRPHRPPKDGEGFTLIETIIALVILSVGILAVATLSSTSIWQVRRGQDLTNATLAAQQVMEAIEGTPYDSVFVGSYGDTITMGGIPYTVAWKIIDSTDSLGARGAEVKQVFVISGGGLTQTTSESFEMTLYKPSGNS